MNALIECAPHTVTVGGELFAIDPSFTTGIRFEALMLDDSLAEPIKTALALNLYFPVIPTDTENALKAIAWFYRCGKEPAHGKEDAETAQGRRIYDYAYDADCILDSFLQQYHIDLQKTDLHWWRFRSLFDNLSEDTPFVKRLGFRCANIGKMKGEQRTYYSRMKRLFALPRCCAESEKDRLISDALLNGGNVQTLLETMP